MSAFKCRRRRTGLISVKSKTGKGWANSSVWMSTMENSRRCREWKESARDCRISLRREGVSLRGQGTFKIIDVIDDAGKWGSSRSLRASEREAPKEMDCSDGNAPSSKGT